VLVGVAGFEPATPSSRNEVRCHACRTNRASTLAITVDVGPKAKSRTRPRRVEHPFSCISVLPDTSLNVPLNTRARLSLRRRTLHEHAAHALPSSVGLLGKVRGLFRHSEAWLREPTNRETVDFSARNHGGRDRDRTCDPHHVKVALSDPRYPAGQIPWALDHRDHRDHSRATR
jgi:hypothetical protein